MSLQTQVDALVAAIGASFKSLRSYTSYSSGGGSNTPVGSAARNFQVITAQAAAMTINAPSGTLSDGNTLLLRIKDNGTARALTWNSIYRVVGTTLPTTTVVGKVMYVGAIYNSAETVWDVISVGQQA